MAAPLAPRPPACEHSMIVEEMSKVRDLISQLRAIVLPSVPKSRSAEVVISDLFEDIFGSFSNLLPKLQACPHFQDAEPDEWDSPRKRRRLDSWTILTTVPHNDGHQWRKYGQKNINCSEFPRHYYRCIYHKEQGCPATKKVQQKDGKDDPPKFDVIYEMKHTCIITGTSSPSDTDFSPKQALCSTKEALDPSAELAYGNNSRTESPFFTDTELNELLLSEPNINTPPMEDIIPNSLASFEFGVDWNSIDGLQELL